MSQLADGSWDNDRTTSRRRYTNKANRSMWGNIQSFWLSTLNTASLSAHKEELFELASAEGFEPDAPRACVYTETAAAESTINSCKFIAESGHGHFEASPPAFSRGWLGKPCMRGEATGVAMASWGLKLHNYGRVDNTDPMRVQHFACVLGQGISLLGRPFRDEADVVAALEGAKSMAHMLRSVYSAAVEETAPDLMFEDRSDGPTGSCSSASPATEFPALGTVRRIWEHAELLDGPVASSPSTPMPDLSPWFQTTSVITTRV